MLDIINSAYEFLKIMLHKKKHCGMLVKVTEIVLIEGAFFYNIEIKIKVTKNIP